MLKQKERRKTSNTKLGNHPSVGNIATVKSLSGKSLITCMLIPVRENGIYPPVQQVNCLIPQNTMQVNHEVTKLIEDYVYAQGPLS
jgi:hypothetical protein